MARRNPASNATALRPPLAQRLQGWLDGWRGAWVSGDRPLGWRVWRAARWGLIWSAPLLILAWWAPVLAWYALAAPLGALAAVSLALVLPPTAVLDLRHPWPWSELLELPLIGALYLALGWLL